MPSSNPVMIDKEKAVRVVQEILREPGDFIGFVDSSGMIIEFNYDESGEVWVEIPYPDEKRSYGKLISKNDLESFIEKLPKDFTKKCIPGAEIREW